MKIIKCDKCLGECGPDIITVKGFSGLSGGILLPDSYSIKDFCCVKCFTQWLIEDAQIVELKRRQNE